MMLGFGIRYGMSLQSAAVLLSPFGLAAVAGARLLIDNERDALSIVAQLPQVLFWSIGRSVWQFCAGLYVPIGFTCPLALRAHYRSRLAFATVFRS
jgi:hypothetical protein